MNRQEPQSDESVTLTVGGIRYNTTTRILVRYPDTLLGRMYKDDILKKFTGTNNYTFGRDGRVFHYILEFYKTGNISWPDEESPTDTTSNYTSTTSITNNSDDNYISNNNNNNKITRQQIEKEMLFFDIPGAPALTEEEKLNHFASMLIEIGLKMKWFIIEYQKRIADVDVIFFDGKSDESHLAYGRARAYQFQVDGFTLLTGYQKEIQDCMNKIAPKLGVDLDIEKHRAT
ncbi:4244_t:CDS:2, partial [Ambispora leptoticha]